MYTADQAKQMVNSAFGEDHIMPYKAYYVNSVVNSSQATGLWVYADTELMNEVMVYGANQYSQMFGTYISPTTYTIDKTQLSLFRLYPRASNFRRETFWLRDTYLDTDFCVCDGFGGCGHDSASNTEGIRPIFAIFAS